MAVEYVVEYGMKKVGMFRLVLFFLLKQQAAYEMRISDWSSDVCSSDLDGRGIGPAGSLLHGQPRHGPGDGQDAAAEGLCRWRVRRYGRRSCKGQPRSRSARQAGDACMTEPDRKSVV